MMESSGWPRSIARGNDPLLQNCNTQQENQMIDMTDVERPLTQSMAREWCAALRSGTFEQGHECLTQPADEEEGLPERDCCLGVANKIFNLAISSPRLTLSKHWPSEESMLLLPRHVQETLYNLNDGLGGLTRHSFEQIATYIETEILPRLAEETQP